MTERSLDWKSLVIGLLLGVSAILIAAQDQKVPESLSGHYRITTGASTWIINSETGDVWQLSGEQGSTKYTWVYAGKPSLAVPKTACAPFPDQFSVQNTGGYLQVKNGRTN